MFFRERPFSILALFLLVQMIWEISSIDTDTQCFETTLMKKVCLKPGLFNLSECPDLNFTSLCYLADTTDSLPYFADCPWYIGSFTLGPALSKMPITWPKFEALDRNGTSLPITKLSGGENGSYFEAGRHEVHYKASNSFGDSYCSIKFKIQVVCLPPKNPAGGEFPCSDGNRQGSLCSLKCLHEFIPSKEAVLIECHANRSWYPDHQFSCKDICRPHVLNCPLEIIAITDASTARVKWEALSATDNGGTQILYKQTRGLPSGSALGVGNSVNVFEISDGAGNIEICQFNITVIDKSCQSILSEGSCNTELMDCVDLFSGSYCNLNCNLRENIMTQCSSSNFKKENEFCTEFDIKFLYEGSSVYFPRSNGEQSKMTLEFSLRLEEVKEVEIFYINSLDKGKVFRVYIEKSDDEESTQHNLVLTYESQTIKVADDMVNMKSWNHFSLSFEYEYQNGSWIINGEMNINKSLHHFEKHTNETEQTNPIFGKNFRPAFPPGNKGLQVCGFKLISNGRELISLKNLTSFEGLLLGSPTFTKNRESTAMSCKTTRECVEGTGTCTCEHGYQGENCDIRPDPCYGNLCKNSATCIPGANDTFKCVCSQQYTGKYCEVLFDCLNFKLQSDVILSCDGNLSTLICNVTCKPGKFRADLYHTETQFECGTASGNAWQISGTKTKIADFEFPMCSEVVPPVTMTVEMEALVPNLRCNELVLSSCNDNACKINQTSNCTQIGSSISLVHKLSTNLDCRNLELPIYFRNENVSDCLQELVQSYISMEQMIEEMKTIYVKNTTRRRRSRILTSKYATAKKEEAGLFMEREIVRRFVYVQAFSCCWLPIIYYPLCPSGSVIHNGMCVYCPAGSYEKDQYKCEYCAAGYYQDRIGQSECKTCPVGYISPVGSTTLLDCEDFFQRNNLNEDEASGDSTVEIICAVFGGLISLAVVIGNIISYKKWQCVCGIDCH